MKKKLIEGPWNNYFLLFFFKQPQTTEADVYVVLPLAKACVLCVYYLWHLDFQITGGHLFAMSAYVTHWLGSKSAPCSKPTISFPSFGGLHMVQSSWRSHWWAHDGHNLKVLVYKSMIYAWFDNDIFIMPLTAGHHAGLDMIDFQCFYCNFVKFFSWTDPFWTSFLMKTSDITLLMGCSIP